MDTQSGNDEPLQALKHDAVPGYMRAFVIAFAIMGIYLAIILVSSPGKAKKHYHGSSDSYQSEETPAKSKPEKPHE